MKSIAVIGPGAVGSVIAYELDAQLFGRREDLLTLAIDHQSYQLNVSSLMLNNHSFDYIFIAVKSTQLETILPAVQTMAHKATKIILCQNGIGQETLFDRPVIPAVVYISGQKQGRQIKHFRDKTLIIPASSADETIRRLACQSALNIQLSETFERERWFKLLVNLGINTVTALAKNTAHIMQLEEIRQLVTQLLSEGISIASKEGIDFDEKSIDDILAIYSEYPAEMGTSMYYDMLNDNKTEYDFIQGTCLRLAQKHQLDVPAIELTTTLLKAYQYKKK